MGHVCRTRGTRDFPQEAIQCLDVVLRSTMSLKPVSEVAAFAQSFFIPPSPSIPLGRGAEVSTSLFHLLTARAHSIPCPACNLHVVNTPDICTAEHSLPACQTLLVVSAGQMRLAYQETGTSSVT